MSELPYASIPDAPVHASATSVMMRMIDGLAFRYRWATEGLRPEDVAFDPGAESQTPRQLLAHILWLANAICRSVGADQTDGDSNEIAGRDDIDGVRRETLERLQAARVALEGLSDEEFGRRTFEIVPGKRFPVWNVLNGPLADALTHVGQMNAWRRLSGNPTPRVNVFLGRPPRS